MSRLLVLPWEVRESIWKYALQRDVPVRRPRSAAHYEFNRPTTIRQEHLEDNVASLLCTCRQVEEEAAPIFYRTNDICPYFSRYTDQADYKSDTPWLNDVPSSKEWTSLSESVKYQTLGLAAKYSEYIVSLVVYNDAVRGFAFDYAFINTGLQERLTGCDPDCTSDLLAEMLFWVRLKLPHVQTISVRYRMFNSIHMYGYAMDLDIDPFLYLETRFWRAVKCFPHLSVLEICVSYASPKAARVWNPWRPLYRLPANDRKMTRWRDRFIGPNLREAAFCLWLELSPSAAEEVLRSGMRWVFTIRPKRPLKSHNRDWTAYLRWKGTMHVTHIDPYEREGSQQRLLQLVRSRQNPFAHLFRMSSDQAFVDRMILTMNQPHLDNSLTEEQSQLGDSKLPNKLWTLLQSLPLSLRSLVWAFALRRGVPLHWCSEGSGNPFITALLMVNRQTYLECRLLFVQMNTFSVNPCHLPKPFASRSDNSALDWVLSKRQSLRRTYETPNPLLISVKERLNALRSLRFYMVQSLAVDVSSDLARRAAVNARFFNDALDYLNQAAPLLRELSLTHYTEVFRQPDRVDPHPWHHKAMQQIRRFRHLRRFTLLTCLEKSMCIGVPWQQRIAELDPTSAVVAVSRTSGVMDDYLPHEILPPLMAARCHMLPRGVVLNHVEDILKPFGARWTGIRVHFWPIEELRIWDGTAWVVDLAPLHPPQQDPYYCDQN